MIYFIFILFSCNNIPTNRINDQNLMTLSTRWKNDSLNCNGERNIESLKQIIGFINEKKEKSNVIIRYLGRPNIETPYGDGSIDYCYYISSGCFTTKKDNCYMCISIDLKKDQLVIKGKTCE